MARAMKLTGSSTYVSGGVVAVPRSPLYQAYQVLHWGFCALPVVAGLDKFAHLLVDWNQYLAPRIGSAIEAYTPVTAGQFMLGVGLIEVLAGLVVAIKPKIGGYLVALWLAGIIANLIVGMQYFDVALRDFGLMLGALALGMLARHFGRAHKVDEVVKTEAIEYGDTAIVPPASSRRVWAHRERTTIE